MPRRGLRAGVPPGPTLGAAGAVGSLTLGGSPARREMVAAMLDAEARETLANVRFDDPASLRAVAARRHAPASVKAAKEALAGGATSAPRWAAVWILTSED